MDFSSDTSAPAHPSVIEAIAAANSGMQGSYGADSHHDQLRAVLRDVLETDDFDFWLTSSGTAANALALSCFCPPTGAILCHPGAHIAVDERGAPEFFTGGGKLQLLGGPRGQIAEGALKAALLRINHDFVHETPAHVLSLTNLTENGCTYSAEQTQSYCNLADAAGLSVHLDGARVSNAVIFTGASVAELSWKAGVDVLTLGLTKTGAMGCEIILLFGQARAKLRELQARAKRSGHMPAKMRYLAAQAVALLRDGLWLDLARHANDMASALSQMFATQPGCELAFPTEGNEVFVNLPEAMASQLYEAGGLFYPWMDGSHRFVCSWTTQQADIDALATAMA